jgi:Poly(R)-hydroxyalkanoic acid synthase subunit (PHA_synth_III_E)
MIPGGPFSDPEFVQRTLMAYSQQVAGLAALVAGQGIPGGAGLDLLRQPMIGAYQHLFTPAGPSPAQQASAGAAAGLRWQRASEPYASLVAAIASDAWARLARALTEEGPEAAPITSLAALHALWIDCGESAWADAAHREDFAEAQAELLAALVGLKAAGGR